MRGRVFLYAGLLLLGGLVFALALTRRRPFEAELQRSGGRPYVVEGARVHNVFNLQLINKRPGERSFSVEVVGPPFAETVVAAEEVVLDSLGSRRIPVHVFVPLDRFRAGLRAQLRVVCADPEGLLERVASAPLLGPSAR